MTDTKQSFSVQLTPEALEVGFRASCDARRAEAGMSPMTDKIWEEYGDNYPKEYKAFKAGVEAFLNALPPAPEGEAP